MNIILTAINAKYIHSNLAVRYLKSFAEKNNNISIKILEFTINNYIDEMLKAIHSEKPDVICFSCYIWNYEIVKKLCTLLKILLPQIKIVLGGPEVSYNINDVFNECDIDFLIYGEGERSFSELVSFFLSEKILSSIDGIAYRANNEIVINKPSKPFDMGELPFPYNDFTGLENRIIYYEASRGCPFSCQYCLSSIEKGVRLSPIEKVKKELSVFIERKIPQIKFVDRTFNCNKAFAKEIISFLIKSDNGTTNFHFEVAADLLDDELLELFGSARDGLFQLEIGVQSTNEKTLEAVQRKNDFSHIAYCVKKLNDFRNIHLHLDLIAGLPLENFDSFKKSFDDVYSLKPHQLQLGFLKVLKGSGIEKNAKLYGIKSSPFSPYEVLETNCLSYEDIIKLKGVEEMTELFKNNCRFDYSVAFLLNNYSSPFEFFFDMSVFMEKTNSQAILSSKLLPYKFLLDFSKEYGYDNEKLKWYLRFDMLLHEHSRSIPEWLDISYSKQEEDSIYKKISSDGTLLKFAPEYAETPIKFLPKYLHIEFFPFNPQNNVNEETILLFKYAKISGDKCTSIMQILN